MSVIDNLQVKLPKGAWVLSVSDIHLHIKQTAASTWVENELSKRIADHHGPGAIVLNGDIIELWAGHEPNIQAALQTHSKLAQAILDFSKQPDCHVVFVVGNHDGEVGWREQDQEILKSKLGAKLCFRAELDMNGKVVAFEHGHQLDPDNSFEDPRDPHDHPMGQYVVQKILPLAQKSKSDVLNDVDTLADPHRFPVFLFSRIFYRAIVSNAGWLLLPFAIALVYRLLIVIGFYFLAHQTTQKVLDFFVLTDAVIILDILLVFGVGYFVLLHFWKLSASLVDERGGSDHNHATRELAKREIKSGKTAGATFGHTHVAELTELPGGFYANSGSGTKITKSYRAKLRLPNVYVPSLQLSWLEFEVGDKLKVTLFAGNRKIEGAKRYEKLLLQRSIVYTEPKQVKTIEV